MASRVTVSVVVVCHDMLRELPRTLRTLDPRYQRGIGAGDYEVVLVDNGSSVAPSAGLVESFDGALRVEVIDDPPPSPACAANVGVAMARGDLIGLIIDGARMASPGLLAMALLGSRLADRPVITAPAWHLGHQRQMEAAASGYDQAVEDDLLAEIPWETDGYSLFSISTLAGSSARGWFGPMGESSALFLPRTLWNELGGLDERFDLPGGGLVNHDLYRRACDLAGSQLIVVLGEGTFHQFHGGAATSGRLSWDQMHDQYVEIRGQRYQPPQTQPLYVGTIPVPALQHVAESARIALERLARSPSRRDGHRKV
jgi:hypothetical protein